MMRLFIFVLLLLEARPGFCEDKLWLRSLENASVQSIETQTNKAQVVMLFQKDCSSCKLQLKDFNCLQDKAKVLLLGAFAPELELRTEVRKLQAPYPSYLADKETLETLNLKSGVTPQTLVWDSQGQRHHLIGLQPCSQILNIITKS